jgi:ABC-2 type transport system ATP-binding protein
MIVIQAHDLTKRYRVAKKREGIGGAIVDLFRPRHEMLNAVNGVSFSLERGEMVGYIGANGSRQIDHDQDAHRNPDPTSGEILVNGYVPSKERRAYTRTIGAVFGPAHPIVVGHRGHRIFDSS